ncbi:DUF1129 domain-containing protein [Streptococcus thoraltensis]|uniref:DUF1129 domain-containing protein n=1 Tax=Streptococcus thoraltensis TaxID=55085 RepID=UPI000381DCA3|nr:DUF1129 family protein [Streptococcus thoraltensis]MDY4761215.1 DUF1129 family protein [Streptococcus thoraltensis]
MDLNNLTHKNQEFIHIATKQLIQDGKTDAEIKTILEDILPSIEENQKNGVPARSFLGAPTSWAAQFTKSAEEEKAAAQEAKNTNPWLMWMDASLFWLGFLGLILGILALDNSKSQSYGILTLIVVGLGGGAFLYATYYYVYRHMGKEKAQRPSFWKSIILLGLLMVGWLLLFSATTLLPAAINPQLPPLLLILIGAIAFAVRYYFKKKYNILSAMSAQAAPRR